MRNDNIDFQPDGWSRNGDGGLSANDPRIQTAVQGPGGGSTVRNQDLDFQPDGQTHPGDGGPLANDPRIQFQTARHAPAGGAAGGGAAGGAGIEFQPDTWLRSGSAYSGNASAFTSAAQQVLDSTTSLSPGGANPLDAAVSSILSDMSARGSGVISSIGRALDGIGSGMISTGVRYRGLESEQSSIASGAQGREH